MNYKFFIVFLCQIAKSPFKVVGIFKDSISEII